MLLERKTISVTVVSTVTTGDVLGDSTATTTRTDARALYAPRASQEGTDSHSPKVYVAASLYFVDGLPDGVTLDSDDTVVITDVHPLVDGTYQVEGIPGYWGGPVEVAVTRTGGV